MRVEIFSVMAALVGGRDVTWRGEISLAELQPETDDPDQINAALWRFFNRVDEGDGEKLAEIGYELPSLSVGDFIRWDEFTFQVRSRGFRRITGSEKAVMEFFTEAMS